MNERAHAILWKYNRNALLFVTPAAILMDIALNSGEFSPYRAAQLVICIFFTAWIAAFVEYQITTR